MINRRQLLLGCVTIVAVPRVPKIPWIQNPHPKVFEPYLNFERTLFASDMREVAQYFIAEDNFMVRHDIKFVVNARGAMRQLSCQQIGNNPEQVREGRKIALARFQEDFDRKRRIRGNLVRLPYPAGVPDKPDWWPA